MYTVDSKSLMVWKKCFVTWQTFFKILCIGNCFELFIYLIIKEVTWLISHVWNIQVIEHFRKKLHIFTEIIEFFVYIFIFVLLCSTCRYNNVHVFCNLVNFFVDSEYVESLVPCQVIVDSKVSTFTV